MKSINYSFQQNKSKISIPQIILVILIIFSLYMSLNIISPTIIIPITHNKSNIEKRTSPLEATKNTTKKNSKKKGNLVIIPSIEVEEYIYDGGEEVLKKGVWHRKPEHGNPEEGGNFILTAHRLTLGFTPNQTRKRSPFYNIHKLSLGDEINIIWNEKEYLYKITKIYTVTPYDIQIEDQTATHQLTLYSCTLQGADHGRLVIEADLSNTTSQNTE